MANRFDFLAELKPIYREWATYSVELLKAIRTESVFWQHWNEVKIIDKIIAVKVGSH